MTVRSARPTIRCLTEDLGIELPLLGESLDDLDHPWLDELRRVADTSPQGQKRIESIDHPLVFRLRVSDHRGATWVDESCDVVWLCAVHKREDGSEDDAYEWFCGLHKSGDLLPTEEDQDRLLIDAAIQTFRTVETDLLMTFAKDPASRDHREPSRSLVACGNESARYYAKVIKARR